MVSKFARLSRRPYAGGQTAAKKVPDAPSFGFVIPVEFSPFRLQSRERKLVAGDGPQPTFALVKDRAATRNNLGRRYGLCSGWCLILRQL